MEVEEAESEGAPAGSPMSCARRSVIDPAAGADAMREKDCDKSQRRRVWEN